MTDINPPANLEPTKLQNAEWDKPQGASPKKELEEYDAEIWANEENEEGTDFPEDIGEESGDEQPPVEAKEEEEDIPEDEGEDEEDTFEEPTSSRANDRIRQLVGRAKEAESRANSLEQRLAQFIELQERQADMQARLFQEEQSRRQMQAAEEFQRKHAEQLKAYGYDETNVAHVLALQAFQAAQEARKTAEMQKEAYENRAKEASYKAYQTALKTELEKSLLDPKSGKSVVDDNVKSALYTAAYALAREEQIKDPSEAVKRIVAPLVSNLKPKVAPSKRPDPNDNAHKAISTSGKTAGKSPGTKASGKKPLAKDVLAFLR